jgi:N-hydroxyarylamine O-acetyltransferase
MEPPDLAAPGSPFVLSDEQTKQYLARLGWSGSVTPNLETLRALHLAHLTTIPFENLDIHLGVPIELDVERTLDKIIGRERGGFCFELNPSFAALLTSVGFPVRLMEAQVYEADGPGIRFAHLCLAVDAGSRYLVDVGFGRSFDGPIVLDGRDDQPDTAGTFRLEDADDGRVDLRANGALAYRLSPAARSLDEFAAACVFHQTSPDSLFTRGTLCTRRTPQGRTTLAGTTLIETAGGARRQRELDAHELGPALEEHFGIALPAADIAVLARCRAA